MAEVKLPPPPPQQQQRLAERMLAVNERLGNCERLAVESETMGAATLSELDAQGEQLTRIERLRRNVDANLVHAKHHISATGSWLYAIFASAPKAPARQPVGSRQESPQQKRRQEQQQQPQQKQQQTQRRRGESPTEAAEPRAGPTFAPGSMEEHLEHEYNAGVDRLAHSVQRMRHLAQQIGTELDRQNAQLDQLDRDLDGTEVELQRQHRRVTGLLK